MYGGAIFNNNTNGTIGEISGNFIGNHVQSLFSGDGANVSKGGYGGAIRNIGTITNIIADFVDNYALAVGDQANGGAIHNNGSIGKISGDFINNHTQSEKESVYGGAIFNNNTNGTIGEISGNFIGNHVQSLFSGDGANVSKGGYGGAIYNANATITSIVADFIDNYALAVSDQANGGAIHNSKTIGKISGDFIGNYTQSEKESVYGGAIFNSGTINEVSGEFRGNYAQSLFGALPLNAAGGAIYNKDARITLVNSSFYDNYAKAETTDKSGVKGGAIYSKVGGTLNIVANDGQQSVFRGNKIIFKGEAGNYAEESNAIHMGGGALNLSAVEGGQIIFDDKITAEKGVQNTASAPINEVYVGAAEVAVEGRFVSKEVVGDDIEASLNNAVIEGTQQGLDVSWEEKDGKYIMVQKQVDGLNYEGFKNKITILDEIGGYMSEDYRIMGGFATSDMYGGNLKAYLDSAVEQGLVASYYYSEKDGVYYATLKDGNMVGNATFREDIDAGGVWMEMEVPAQDKPESYFVSLEEVKNFEMAGIPYVEKNGCYYFQESDWVGKISANGYMDANGKHIEQEQLEQMLAEAKEKGKTVSVDENGNVVVSRKIYGGKSGYFYQNDAGEVLFYNYLDNGVMFSISGDGSGKIVFNEDIDHDGTITVSNTEVEVNAKGFDRANLKDGAIVDVGAGGVVKDTIVGAGSLLKIKEGAKALVSMIANGGKLLVQKGGEADDSVVFSGGMLETEVQARLNNLLAHGGAILDLDAGTVLTGNIVIDSAAEMGGEYDYSKIFKDEVTETGSLTLVGGMNDKLTEGSLVNSTADKKLYLTDGEYLLGKSTLVKGWDKLTISEAVVKLDGAIEMADANKPINLTSTSELDLAGNSPLITTIIGSLNNDGILNFHHDSDDADDVINIYGNYTAFDNAKMYIDVNTESNKADQMLVDGDVLGTTKVTIYKKGSEEVDDLIKFVDAPNDDAITGAYFKVDHVYGEALDLTDQWKIVYQDNAWYVTSAGMTVAGAVDGYGTANSGKLDADMAADAVLPPDFPDVPSIVPEGTEPPTPDMPDIVPGEIETPMPTYNKVYAEVLGYMALPSVGLEQIRDLGQVVTNKVAASKRKCKNCGVVEHMYNGNPLKNVWVDVGHRKSEMKAPVDVEAKINNVDMGFDVQSDLHNRLGVFASYRQGDYELSGKGRKYFAANGAEFELDSWMLGAYYRYDKGRIWVMNSVYGGVQDVKLMTDTGVASDTKGWAAGFSAEAGMVFEPRRHFTVEPSVRLAYNMLKYDNMKDDYGKQAKFENIGNVEAELGVKLEYVNVFDRRNIFKMYFKPSVIQNVGEGDVCVNGLQDSEGVKNQTLFRGEIGASLSMDNGWNGFGYIGHSFGNSYSATDFNIGVGYSW